MIIFTCSFYKSFDDVRYKACIEALQQAAQHKITVVVVDASPTDEFRQQMSTTGAVSGTPQKTEDRLCNSSWPTDQPAAWQC